MSIGLPKRVLRQAMEANRELAEYLEDTLTNGSYNQYHVSFDETPIKFLKIVHEHWKKYVDENDKGDENDYSFNREKERFTEFTKNLENCTTKLKNKARSLLDLSVKMKAFFEQNIGERAWVYLSRFDGCSPYLVRSITYYPKDNGRDYADIEIKFVHNSGRSFSSRSIHIDTDDMREHQKDVVEILKAKGVKFETDEMYKQYRKDEKHHNQALTWQSKQITHKGKRYINDSMFYMSQNTDRTKERTTTHFTSDKLMEIPNDLVLYAYDLSEHSFSWIQSKHVALYEYDKSIEKKLILPDEHKNLINILLSEEIKELGSDIIAGKGQGTLILTKGKAGLGKTATSEIYSENKEVALLSVHSGQLGTNGDAIEKKLKHFFELAERWGCILLIDEADVYIRKRGDDVNHNAIVATFLRTMEYYSGTMFMTTNRTDDVDEAIESRCIAVLSYSLPSQEMTNKLWSLFLGQYNVEVTEETLTEVCAKMNEMSGRDIKNITMLVSRYSQGMKIAKPDFDVFKLCATFRGKYEIGKEH